MAAAGHDTDDDFARSVFLEIDYGEISFFARQPRPRGPASDADLEAGIRRNVNAQMQRAVHLGSLPTQDRQEQKAAALGNLANTLQRVVQQKSEPKHKKKLALQQWLHYVVQAQATDVQCLLCMETCYVNRMRTSSCGHSYCLKCLAKHCSTQLLDSASFPRCPDPECLRELTQQELSAVWQVRSCSALHERALIAMNMQVTQLSHSLLVYAYVATEVTALWPTHLDACGSHKYGVLLQCASVHCRKPLLCSVRAQEYC
jgi:hypothetical protein